MSGDVTAAIERLRAEAGLAPVGAHLADDVLAVLAEVERLRAEVEDAVEGLRESENQHRITSELWRAEREALHSEEAWERACKEVSLRLFEGTEWLDLHQDDRRIISFYVGAVIDSLTADWEATQ